MRKTRCRAGVQGMSPRGGGVKVWVETWSGTWKYRDWLRPWLLQLVLCFDLAAKVEAKMLKWRKRKENWVQAYNVVNFVPNYLGDRTKHIIYNKCLHETFHQRLMAEQKDWGSEGGSYLKSCPPDWPFVFCFCELLAADRWALRRAVQGSSAFWLMST